MATEYTCITCKIEVHLHRHGDSEEDLQRYKDEFHIWDEINNNLYKVANFITSHLFFNDAFVDRLKIQSNAYLNIVKALSNTSDDKETKRLVAEKKALESEFNKQKILFLKGGADNEKGSEKTAVRRLAVESFPEIPYAIKNRLTDTISKTYSANRFDVSIGKRTLPHYKKGMPIPFLMTTGTNKIALRQREDGSHYILFPRGLEWDLCYGRDRSNYRAIVEGILSGRYKACDSSIQEAKNRKRFLQLVVKIPKETKSLNDKRVVGVDLGINIPLYAALNDNEQTRLRIGSREKFLDIRCQMNNRRRALQKDLRHSTKGGHGRTQKLQALERLKAKERNWVRLQNHIFSKSVIEFAQKHNAGVIQLEHLTGIGKDENNEVTTSGKFLTRYWSYHELQTFIEYKADAVGIEVRYINPYHTSQTCSFCGHYEAGQRIDQPTFICKNPDCEKGKGKQHSDGTYKGINADWNAARNIALSKDFVDKKKK